jgi:hypothetical protein
MVDRFREADCDAVLSMWRSQTNEGGQRLSRSEREALIERHCELFGTWPVCAPGSVEAHTFDDLELADRRLVEAKRRVADQPRRTADQECVDVWRLSKSVLVNFEVSLQLMIWGHLMVLLGFRHLVSHYRPTVPERGKPIRERHPGLSGIVGSAKAFRTTARSHLFQAGRVASNVADSCAPRTR